MIIQHLLPMLKHTGKPHLTISVRLPSGHEPISHFRGMNVGVGGRFTYCTIAPGEPVRRATLAELRLKDRQVIARFLAQYPDGQIVVRRSYH